MAFPQKVGQTPLHLWYTGVINNERLHYTAVHAT